MATNIQVKDIVDTAVDAGSFKTLAAALSAAGLIQALKGTGPFTVFAPTDEAFAKLPTGAVDALLKDIPKLTKILKYHVVSGRFSAKDVAALKTLRTLEGGSVAVDITTGVKIDGANVITPDIQALNGTIHVIDAVILPA
jgi:uncharacterized surface protein with fasciclin (FAS1) repeats